LKTGKCKDKGVAERSKEKRRSRYGKLKLQGVKAGRRLLPFPHDNLLLLTLTLILILILVF
jgi:hypothetical protein